MDLVPSPAWTPSHHKNKSSYIKTNLLENNISNRLLQPQEHRVDDTHFQFNHRTPEDRHSVGGSSKFLNADQFSSDVQRSLYLDRVSRQHKWNQMMYPVPFSKEELLSTHDTDVSSCADSSTSGVSVKRSTSVPFTEYDDHIGVCKRGTIFQPINMYSPSRPKYKETHPHQNSQKSSIIEYDTLILSPSASPDQCKPRRGKGLTVTFSNASVSDIDISDDDRLTEASYKRSKSQKSLPRTMFKSATDSVPSIGVAWNINSGRKSMERFSGTLSKNLNPVTNGLNKAGTSTSKTIWRVSSSQYFNRPFMPLTRYNIKGKASIV